MTVARRWRQRSLCLIFVVATLLLSAIQVVAAEGAPALRPWRWSEVERVVVIGDVHGAFDDFFELLRGTALITADGSWAGGGTHLVLLGDLLDRGPAERQVMDLVMRLQGDALAAGGRVHLLLGNHEVMNLLGDLRYVSDEGYAAFAAGEDPALREAACARWMRANGYGRKQRQAGRLAFDESFPPGYFARRQAFAATGRYGAWLLDQDVLVVVNGVVYVHGGLAPCLAELAAEEINAVAMAELSALAEARQRLLEHEIIHPETGYHEQHEIARDYVRRWRSKKLPLVQDNLAAADALKHANGALVVRSDGPLWYRGTSLNPADEEAPLMAELLARLDASRVVVGHTPSHTGRVAVRLDGSVVMADTGMLRSHYKGRAAALIDRGGEMLAYYPGEGESPLPGSDVALSEGELVASSDELEEILRTAAVVATEDVGSGTTRPLRVTLEVDGTRYRAIFKSADTPDESGVALDASHDGHPNRYQHEIAAYRLDRLLGLGMVPPTVARRIAGVDGSLQLWVENAISERARRDEDLQPGNGHQMQRQLEVVRIFDTLIHNPHRNSTNLLVTTNDWRLHLIDHAAAFLTELSPPAELAGAPLALDLDIVNRLRVLDRGMLQDALSPLIGDAAITALLTRRDQILAPWRAADAENEPRFAGTPPQE